MYEIAVSRTISNENGGNSHFLANGSQGTEDIPSRIHEWLVVGAPKKPDE